MHGMEHCSGRCCPGTKKKNWLSYKVGCIMMEGCTISTRPNGSQSFVHWQKLVEFSGC
jgi:hypothetical protein